MLKQNKYYSYNTKKLPKGCQYCVKGEKLVLFVTGICPRKCYFCPVSDDKIGKDVTYANELKIENINENMNEIIKEAKNMNAKGMGITGGDPLSRIDRTVECIKLLKKTFGKKFHIHLYTSLNLATEQNLQKLYEAGLDEIRFHLDLDSEKFWRNIERAKKNSWDVGVEIPMIPTKQEEIKKMIDYVHDKVDFLNMNELELADNSMSQLYQIGFKPKDKISYAVKDSINAGLQIMEYAKKYNLPMHLCTAKLKDKVQLGNRIKREGKTIKKEFETLTEEGLLKRGVLYLPELKPGFGYQKKIAQTDKKMYIEKLNNIKLDLQKKLNLKEKEIYTDAKKLRILISEKNAKKHKKLFIQMKLCPAIVTEYPTADQLEMEIEFVKNHQSKIGGM